MKIKHLLIGMLAMAAAVACKQDEPVEEPSLEVNKTAVALAATAGEATFNVTANNAWSAEADADWVSLDPASGAGAEKAVAVSVTAEDNTAAEARTATVTVKSGNLTRTVKVTQAAAEAGEEPGPGDDPGDDPEVEPATYVLVGEAVGGWDVDKNGVVLTLKDGYYEAKGVAVTAKKGMHFTKNNKWEGNVKGLHGLIAPNEIGEVGNNDISLTEGGAFDVYLTEALDKFYFMTEGKLPSEAVEHVDIAVTWGMMGCFVDNTWAKDVPMTKEGEWIVAKGAQFTELTFKIRANESWADATNIGLAPGSAKGEINTKVSVVTAEYAKANLGGDAADIKLNGEAGTYDVYFSYEKLELYVMTSGYKPGDEVPEEPVDPDQPAKSGWYIVGSFTGTGWGWDAAAGIELDVLDANYFVYYGLELTEGAQFKFLQGTAWGAAEVGAAASVTEPNTIQVKGSQNIAPPAGKYDIYLAADASKFFVMSEGKTPAEATEPAPVEVTYTVAGTVKDNNWNTSYASALMVAEGNYLVAKNLELLWASTMYNQAEQIEIKIFETGTWNGYGAADANATYAANDEIPVAVSGGNIVVLAPEGTYDVYFDKENGKVWVMEPGLKPGETPAQPEPEPTPDPELPDATKVVEFNMSETGWPNKYNYVNNEKYYINDDIAFRFRQGNSSTAPTYISDGEYIKMFQNGSTFEVMSNEHTDYVESKYTIKSIEITFAQGHCYLSPDSGELSAEGDVRTWTGNAVNVKFTANGTDSSHRAYVKAIKVVYEAL